MAALEMTQKELDNCLFEACKSGRGDFAKLAIAAGANINAKDIDDWTPLHHAAANRGSAEKALEVAAILIANDSDLNAKTKAGWTPLETAILYGRSVVVKLLEATPENPKGHANRLTEQRKDKGPPQVG